MNLFRSPGKAEPFRTSGGGAAKTNGTRNSYTYNSRVDRHWHIGEGHIRRDALRRIASHPKLRHAAFILETPYDDPRADLKNLEALRSFVDGAD